MSNHGQPPEDSPPAWGVVVWYRSDSTSL